MNHLFDTSLASLCQSIVGIHKASHQWSLFLHTPQIRQLSNFHESCGNHGHGSKQHGCQIFWWRGDLSTWQFNSITTNKVTQGNPCTVLSMMWACSQLHSQHGQPCSSSIKARIWKINLVVRHAYEEGALMKDLRFNIFGMEATQCYENICNPDIAHWRVFNCNQLVNDFSNSMTHCSRLTLQWCFPDIIKYVLEVM